MCDWCKERGSIEWEVIAANDAFCWGCGVCTKICPTKAIKIVSNQ